MKIDSIFLTWIADLLGVTSVLHMRARLCPENRQYLAAHPDKLFLDMMGLVQLLPGSLCCL